MREAGWKCRNRHAASSRPHRQIGAIRWHRLVDALPDESLPAAAILLRRAQDPVAAKLDAAPDDDEELTDEDLSAVKEARSEPGISWSDAEAELNAG